MDTENGAGDTLTESGAVEIITEDGAAQAQQQAETETQQVKTVQAQEEMNGGCAETVKPEENGEKKLNFISALILKVCFGNRALAEIARFLIVGVIATLVDFFAAGVTLYIFQPSLYPNFFNVFYGGGDPSVVASCVSTGVGFLFGLLINYLLSVVFVFEEKGNSKTGTGFVVFALLSAGGLLIHVVGMWLFVDLAGWNYWLIKILLTAIVLVYNYVTRKLIIFKKKK